MASVMCEATTSKGGFIIKDCDAPMRCGILAVLVLALTTVRMFCPRAALCWSTVRSNPLMPCAVGVVSADTCSANAHH